MYCPNCGNQIPDNAVFCTECGSKIEGESLNNLNNDKDNEMVESAPISNEREIVNATETNSSGQTDNNLTTSDSAVQSDKDSNSFVEKAENHSVGNSFEKKNETGFFISANGQINSNEEKNFISKFKGLSSVQKVAAASVLGIVVVTALIFILLKGSFAFKNNDLIIKSDNNTGAAFNFSLDTFNSNFYKFTTKTYNEKCGLDIGNLWQQSSQEVEEGSGVTYTSNLLELAKYGVSLTANVTDNHVFDLQVNIDESSIDDTVSYNCWQNLCFITYGTCGNLSYSELSAILGKLNETENTATTVLKDNIAYTLFYDEANENYTFQATPASNRYLKAFKKTYDNEILDFKKLEKIEVDEETIKTNEMDAFKGIDVSVSGLNGFAEAKINLQDDDYTVSFGLVKLSGSKSGVNIYFDDEKIGTAEFELDKSENLSKGEKINLSFNADEETIFFLKLLGYYFKSDNKEITVPDLKEPFVVDLLTEVEKYIKFTGANGDGYGYFEMPETSEKASIAIQDVYFVYSKSYYGGTAVVFDVVSDNTSLGRLTVKIDGEADKLSTGDKVKIVINPESSGYSEIMERDIRFKEEQKEIEVPELGYYVNSKSELTKEDVESIKKDILKELQQRSYISIVAIEQVNFATIKPTAVNEHKAKAYVEVICSTDDSDYVVQVLLYDVIKDKTGIIDWISDANYGSREAVKQSKDDNYIYEKIG